MRQKYITFPCKNHDKLKLVDREYMGDKPSPEDWSDMMDEYEDFREEFQRVYNDRNVTEAKAFTPEVPDYTYLNMEVTGRLCDSNGIPIVISNDNTILNTRVYEVQYLNVQKATLEYNNATENIFTD